MKNLFKKETSRAGFGLLGLMIASAFLAGVSMMIADVMTLAARAQQATLAQDQVRSFFGRVQGIISVDTSCTASLQGSSPESGLTLKDPDFSNTTVASEGKEISGWKVERLRMESIQPVAGASKMYRGDLFVLLKVVTPTIGVAPTMVKQISGVYFQTTNGAITRCYGTSNTLASAKSTCLLLGGSWSEVPEPKCTLMVASADPNKDRSPSASDEHRSDCDPDKHSDQHDEKHCDSTSSTSESSKSDSNKK